MIAWIRFGIFFSFLFMALLVQAGGLDEDISRLGDASFRTREKASAAIRAAAITHYQDVLTACIAGYASSDDAEVLARLDEIMLPIVERRMYHRPKGFLGLRLENSMAIVNGKAQPAIEAAMVVAGGPSEKAGVREGDLILAMDGEAVTQAGTVPFIALVQGKEPETITKLDILRGNQRMEIAVVLGERPEESVSAFSPQRETLDEFYEHWKASRIEEWRSAQKGDVTP